MKPALDAHEGLVRSARLRRYAAQTLDVLWIELHVARPAHEDTAIALGRLARVVEQVLKAHVDIGSHAASIVGGDGCFNPTVAHADRLQLVELAQVRTATA